MYDAPQPTAETLALADVECLVPCEPGKVIGLWNNFKALAEKNAWATPAEPLYFLKATSSLTAHGSAIPAPPADVGRVAYEGELAVVIGRRAHRVAVDDAAAHILGYTCANDVTAMELLNRRHELRAVGAGQELRWLRRARARRSRTDFDFAAALLRTRVSGRERQNYPLSDMLFSPAELVSRLSHDMTLWPGDVILCGTSIGVMPMKPGSVVEVEIDGLGVLSNTFA